VPPRPAPRRISRRDGLHPADDFDAVRHEGMMQQVEDLRAAPAPTLRIGNAEKKTARAVLVTGVLPARARPAEKNVFSEPFFGGAKRQVVDFELNMAVRWFSGGKVDRVPTTIFAGDRGLMAAHDAMRDHSDVMSWYAKPL
jgi:hypothetical protein